MAKLYGTCEAAATSLKKAVANPLIIYVPSISLAPVSDAVAALDKRLSAFDAYRRGECAWQEEWQPTTIFAEVKRARTEEKTLLGMFAVLAKRQGR